MGMLIIILENRFLLQIYFNLMCLFIVLLILLCDALKMCYLNKIIWVPNSSLCQQDGDISISFKATSQMDEKIK